MSAKRLTAEQKEEIKVFLLQESKRDDISSEMVLGRFSIGKAATKWGVSPTSIRTIWHAMKTHDKDGTSMDVKPRYKGGRVAMVMDEELIKNIELKKRKTIRSLAVNYGVHGISKSTVGRWKKKGYLRAATAAIKPLLNRFHMISRLKFCLNAITVDQTGKTKFKSMDNIVHIDEKWFYLKQVNERYILLPYEETPHNSSNSKHFIPKLMFMCAVSRPIYGPNGELIWDGRLGIWPFVEEVEAQKNSRYRPSGTIEFKPTPSINMEVSRDMIVKVIIPCIKKNWPEGISKVIKIQQDNAPCHVSPDDPVFLAAANSDGFNISLVNQPARSPDTNVNDLGFFCSIQALQQEMQTESMEELIDAVQVAFEVLEPQTLDDVFLSSQQCMVEIMKVRGHNKYKTPHMGKEHLRSIGMLPRDLVVDNALVRECIEYLLEKNQQIDNAFLLENLGYYV